MIRRRLTSKQREALYQSEADKAREAGLGDLPFCNICKMPILRGREWDVSHDPSKGRWLGGLVTGIAHRKCNRDHGAQVETPKFAKSERTLKRHLDFTRSRTPLPGGRDDSIKKTMRGDVVVRATGQSPYPRATR